VQIVDVVLAADDRHLISSNIILGPTKRLISVVMNSMIDKLTPNPIFKYALRIGLLVSNTVINLVSSCDAAI